MVVRREWICLTWFWCLIKCWRSWSRSSGGCGGMALLQVLGFKVFETANCHKSNDYNLITEQASMRD